MSRQDDILGPHPSKHPVFGTWLDYEDKESTGKPPIQRKVG